MHWKMFSSTPGLYPLETKAGDSRYTVNIQLNKVTGENEKCLLFYGKNITDFFANPVDKENMKFKRFSDNLRQAKY